MSFKFQDRSAKVLIVDPSGPFRTMATEVIRGKGFKHICGFSSLKEAISYLEVESIDWIITSIFPDQNENGMNLLKICITFPELRHIHLTFLVDSKESSVLTDAYEKGLMSHMMKPLTRDDFTKKIEEMFVQFEEFRWNTALYSGSGLRGHLIKDRKFRELLEFERNLIRLFPSEHHLFFNLIPPLVHLNQKKEAKSTLHQIERVFPQFKKKVNVYKNQYFPNEEFDQSDKPVANFLNLNVVVVIDNDDIVRSHLKKHLLDIGVPYVFDFDNGLDAFEFVKLHHADFIIQEWKLPKLSGPAFIQRIRLEGKESIPIIVHSSLLKKTDLSFAREIGVTLIIEKPFEQEPFIQSLFWLVQQERKPSDQVSMERKMRSLLIEGQVEEAEKLKKLYDESSSFSDGDKLVIEADFYFQKRDYEKARDAAFNALKKQGDSLYTLNLLGKALMETREFALAAKCFEKAQSLAPQNIERLCTISEIHAEMGDQNAAEESLEKARAIDEKNRLIPETEAKIAIIQGDTRGAMKIMEQLSSLDNLVSSMNNKAVALAKCEMINESISQYEKTLASIPQSQAVIRAIVSYNLGLAFVRLQKLKEAIPPLEEAAKVKGSKVQIKAISLLKRVKQASTQNQGVDLSRAVDREIKSETLVYKGKAIAKESSISLVSQEQKQMVSEVTSILEIQAGDRGCYHIFKNENNDTVAIELMNRPINYKPRQAIERSETHGVDFLKTGAS